MLKTRITHLEETGSTNDAIRECSPEHGEVVTAEVQRSGRGQKGNGWESERGRNLLFSIYLTPHFLPCQEQFHLSQAVALALTETLEKYGIAARIKWPNDIYAGDRKIAGILIENSVGMNGTLLDSVIGIGLNVNQTTFVSDAPNPTSMKRETGRDFDREAVLAAFLYVFGQRYAALESGDRETVAADYAAKLYRSGERHLYRDAEGVFRGRIVRVEPDGELLVERENGEIRGYLFKQIEFVIGRERKEKREQEVVR